MSMYTNTGLVKHAQAALALKTKYMWGGILRPIEQQYDMLFKMYGNKAGTGYSTARWNELSQLRNKGYYGVDCVGLVKSYYWSGKADGGTGSPKYGAPGFPDVNANVMFDAARVKGDIKTLPEMPGVIVYCKSSPHVGVYIGDGWVIESTYSGRGDGVVKTKLSAFKWEYWFQCPYIDYVTSMMTAPKTKKCTLVFPAKVRCEPKSSAKLLGRLTPGNTVTVVIGSETTDSVSGLTYIRLDGDPERWIVNTAI